MAVRARALVLVDVDVDVDHGVTILGDEESGETPDPISPPFNQIRMNKYVYSM